MEIVEPLWLTISTVHDLIKSQAHLASEFQELTDQIKLITLAVEPLLDSADETSTTDRDNLKEILEPVKQILDDAKNTLKLMGEKDKGMFGFLNPFRSKKLEEELKGYQEKLKTFTPILALAVQTRKRQPTSTKSPKSFNVGKIIKNQKAKQFWVQHFGQEYKVEWKRFSAAFHHEFGSKLKEMGIVYKEHASTLRTAIEKDSESEDGHGEVDVYSFNSFVQDEGVFEKFLTLIPKVPSPMASKKRRKSQTGDELEREVKRGKEEPVTSPPQTSKSPSSTKVTTTPMKGKSPMKLSTPQKSTTPSSTKLPGYRLTLLPKTMSEKHPTLASIHKSWHTDNASFGRVMFVALPPDLVVRISRNHFQICGFEDEEGRKFCLTDMSGNGTFLNGVLVGHSNVVDLSDGDEIGILMVKPEMEEIELGYRFEIVYPDKET